MPPPFNGRRRRWAFGSCRWQSSCLVGSSNAVNLTELGLDGLAGGCMLFATAAMTLVV